MRVVVADDDLLLREGLASLLAVRGSMCGERRRPAAARAGSRARAGVGGGRHSDAANACAEGLDAARVIREEFPDIAILMLSAHVEVEHAMELLGSGRGIGYLLKSRVTDGGFPGDAGAVRQGGIGYRPALVSELVPARRRDDPLAAFHAREREVLALIAEGRSNPASPTGFGSPRALWKSTAASDQAEPGGGRRRSPPGVGGDDFPRRLLTRRRDRGWQSPSGRTWIGIRRPGLIRSCPRSPGGRVEINITGDGVHANPMKLFSEFEAALPAEVDVDQRHSGRSSSNNRSASPLADATPTTDKP